MSVAAKNWYNFRPWYGDTYAPVVAPASQLYNVDPSWVSCAIDDMYQGGDPPYVLTPVTAIAQTTDSAVITQSTDPQPQSQAPNGPAQTRTPNMFNPHSAPALAPQPTQDPPLVLPTQAFQPQDSRPQPPSSQVPLGHPVSNLPTVASSIPGFATLRKITPIPASTDPGVNVGAQVVSGGATAVPIAIAGQNVRFESSALVIGLQTITAGVATIAGTPISLLGGGSAILVAGTTVPLPMGSPFLPDGSVTASSDPSQSLYQLGTNTLTIDSTGGYVVEGYTLSPGQPAITISGTIVSLGPSSLVFGTQTYALTTPSRDILTPGAVITAAGQTFTPNPTGFAVAGTTLREGGPAITISGTPIYLGPSGLVIGTSQTTFQFMATSPFPITFATDGFTFAAAPTGLVVNGVETLLPGQALTIGGTVVSLTPGESILLIGSDSITLTRTSTMGLGGLIMSGFGPQGGPAIPRATATTTNTDGAVFTLYAGKGPKQGVVWREMGAITIAVVLWVGFS